MIPVYCTADITPEQINEFLIAAYDGSEEAREAPQDLVIITTLDWSHYLHDEAKLTPEEAKKRGEIAFAHGGGPMKVPSRPPWTHEFQSPFLGYTPEGIYEWLQETKDSRCGRINWVAGVILDDQSFTDHTALLASMRDRGQCSAPLTVRRKFEMANVIVSIEATESGSIADERHRDGYEA